MKPDETRVDEIGSRQKRLSSDRVPWHIMRHAKLSGQELNHLIKQLFNQHKIMKGTKMCQRN